MLPLSWRGFGLALTSRILGTGILQTVTILGKGKAHTLTKADGTMLKYILESIPLGLKQPTNAAKRDTPIQALGQFMIRHIGFFITVARHMIQIGRAHV